MYLTSNEQNNICKRFPKFELSYEKQIHKKVYNVDDIFLQFHLALNIMRGFRTIITKMYALYVNYIQTKK